VPRDENQIARIRRERLEVMHYAPPGRHAARRAVVASSARALKEPLTCGGAAGMRPDKRRLRLEPGAELPGLDQIAAPDPHLSQ